MKEYIFNILIILGIISAVKDLIGELKKIKKDKIIIKGRIKFNEDLLSIILVIIWDIYLNKTLFSNEIGINIDILKLNIAIIFIVIPRLLRGIRNEVRDDGIYIRKEIHKWNRIESYQWYDEDKRGNGNILFYVTKYDDNFYDEEVKFKVNKNDKEKLQGFLNEIGLKVSKTAPL